MLGIAVAVVGFGLISFMPQKWHDRIESIQNYEQDNSAQGRINAWKFAYNVAKDHPIVGGGFAVFNRDMFLRYAPNPEDYHDAHSIYFEVLGEHGFVGIALFLSLGILALAKGNQIRRASRKQPELLWAYDLASMVQVSLVGYAVAGLFLGLAYFDLYYHLIAVLVITERVMLREKAGENVAVSEPVAADADFAPGRALDSGTVGPPPALRQNRISAGQRAPD